MYIDVNSDKLINNGNRTNRSAINANTVGVIINQTTAQREVDLLITSMIWH